jgi:hypothetical protein
MLEQETEQIITLLIRRTIGEPDSPGHQSLPAGGSGRMAHG